MKITIDRDEHGHARGVAIDGWTVLQLIVGTGRNEACADHVVAALAEATKSAKGKRAAYAAIVAANDGVQ